MSIVVYTAITKNYDKLKNPTYINPNVGYICFTDDETLTSDVWKIIHIDKLDHKEPKIVPNHFSELNNYDYSIWIDGSVHLLSDPEVLINFLGENDLATFNAKLWHCPYFEAQKVIEFGMASPSLVRKQVAFMKHNGFPAEQGLSVGTCLIRRHTKQILIFNELWWKQINEFTRRDQISLNYCLWKLNMKQSYIPGTIYQNDYMFWGGHDGVYT